MEVIGLEDSSLSQCIYPISHDVFFQEYWEKKPLYLSRRNSNFYTNLLSYKAVDKIISNSDLRFPCFRLAKDGVQIPITECTKSVKLGSDFDTYLADIDVIFDKYASEDTTIILQALEHHWLPLIEFCRRFSNELPYFTQIIQANAYLTPKTSRGFNPHYDTHDVFILQAEGVKHWRIWSSPTYLPYTTQKEDISSEEIRYVVQSEIPIYDVILYPGDALYIPRGYIHSAETFDSASLHITIGIIANRILDLLINSCLGAQKAIIKDLEFRRAIPVKFQANEDQLLDNKFKLMLDEFINHLDIHSAIYQLKLGSPNIIRQFARGNFLDIHNIDKLEPTTKVYKTTDFSIFKIDNIVKVVSNGNTIEYPLTYLPAIVFIHKSIHFQPNELPELSLDISMSLIKNLIYNGYVSFNK